MSKHKRKPSRWLSGQQNKRLKSYYSSRATAWAMTGSMASQVVGMSIVVATSGSAWVMGLHLSALLGFTIAAMLAVLIMKKEDEALVALNGHTQYAQRIARPDRLKNLPRKK